MLTDYILNFFSNKNVLVTGGTGLIGRQVVDILHETGCHIKTVSLDDVKLNNVDHEIADLSSFDVCKSITKDMDCVFHLAGVKGSIKVTIEKPASFLVPIIMMNTNMLEASRLNKVEKLLYTSSVGAYASAEVFKEQEKDEGDPMDMFPGLAKRMGEQQILSYKIQYNMTNFAVVRLANCFGPGDNFDPENAMVIPSLMSRIYHGENPLKVWGDGSVIRDFCYSKDAAEGIILALYHGTNGKYINIGSGTGISIRELVETLSSFIDFKYEFDTSKSSGFPKRVMDISLAQKILSFNPTTSLVEGLQQTWEWYINNHDEYIKKKNYFHG